MVTWNCTSCLSAAVVVLLSDYLKWDFLVQMCILDTVTRNPVVLFSPDPSRPLQLFKFQDTWLTRTYARGLQNGLDDRRNRITQCTFRAQPPIGTAGACNSLTLVIVSALTSSSVPFSRPPLKNGNATERSRRRNVTTSLWVAGLSACALCGTPKGCGYRGGEGPAHLIVPSCLRWRISSLSCQCSDCMWRRGRGCVATSEKISCLYFIFCSCSTFFSPHHPPAPHASGMSEPYPSKPVF